jgi:hypothetical protein
MIELPNISQHIQELSDISKEIDRIEDEIYISKNIKKCVGNVWGKDYIVKTDLIKLKTSNNEESSKSIYVVDSMIVKCSFAVDLYNCYDEYLKYLNEVKSSARLTSNEIKSFGEDSKRAPIPESVKTSVETAIDQLPDLTNESKAKLKTFILEEKNRREGEYGCYKGLSRNDPFQPVAATALGLRVDYSGFIDEIIKCLQQDNSLTNQIKDVFWNAKKSSIDSELETETACKKISPSFDNALTEAGFIF